MTKRTRIGAAALLAIGIAGFYGANAQTVFTLLTTLTGSEIISDRGNPTGAQFTSKVMATQGIANTATKTVATLPTCNTASKGYVYEVTDASSPTYGGTLTGSSTTLALAVCDGTNWTAH